MKSTGSPCSHQPDSIGIPPAGLEPAASGLRARRHLPFDHGGMRELRRQGSNLRFAINSRASYRSTTPERKRRQQDSNLRRQATGALAMRCLSTRPCLQAEGEGVEPPRPEAHPFSRRDTAPVAVLPTGGPGRSRTCTTPIKSRPLFRIELRSQRCGRQESNLQRPAFQAGALPLELRPREWARLESNQRPPVCKTSARPF